MQKKNIIVQQKNASPHLIFSLLGDQNLSKEQHLTTTKKKTWYRNVTHVFLLLVLECDTCIFIIGIHKKKIKAYIIIFYSIFLIL
jgi:hypothetical protein